MQQNKCTKELGLIKEVACNNEKLTDSLAQVFERSKLRQNFGVLDPLKTRGYSVSSILTFCTIMPFVKAASIYSLLKHGITSMDINAKKDAFCDVKNNHNIDWCSLLYQIIRRFKCLVKNDIYSYHN